MGRNPDQHYRNIIAPTRTAGELYQLVDLGFEVCLPSIQNLLDGAVRYHVVEPVATEQENITCNELHTADIHQQRLLRSQRSD